jgi:adenylate cyclase
MNVTAIDERRMRPTPGAAAKTREYLRSAWRRLTGSPLEEAELPDRVRRTIEQQHDRSELLIGFVQLIVGLAFASLYLASPKAGNGPDLIPWVLSTYLGLTVIRLGWGRVARLPAWSLVLSVIFDMGLLMLLIWSFHLKYGQPPSFYLKAPTLLYVFIFIALRALRFEVRYVVVAGLVAAVGWGLLFGYVLVAEPDRMEVTRDYVTYLTSNSVLIGAEIDKILSILAVTAIIAIALYRARKLLVHAVVEQTASRDLSRFFAPEVASKIKSSRHEIRAGTGEFRDAAILNLDLRGFTHFASTAEPDVVMALLSEYQALMVPVIRNHGGRVDKFLGDGILATFGAVEPSTTYAADGLRALEEVIQTAQHWSETRRAAGGEAPTVNGSLATGRVLFGAVGSDERLEYTVIGDAVNLSAKLEKANKQTGSMVLCDSPTFELAQSQGYLPAAPTCHLAAIQVPGVARPLDLVRLGG